MSTFFTHYMTVRNSQF